MATFSANQYTVSTVPVQVAAQKLGRLELVITNLGVTPVYLGNSSVTYTTGQLLPGIVGASFVTSTHANVFAVVAVGSQSIAVSESS